MKLATFEAAGSESFGAVVGDGIVDLGARLGPDCRALIDLLRHDKMAAAASIVDKTEPDFALGDVRLCRPVPYPEKIICIGVNYADRDAEYGDKSPPQSYPSVFMRSPDSLVAHSDTILRPPESEQLDYEAEIGIIIGKPGRRIDKADYRDHIAGLTCVNEGTLRDWLRHGKFNVTQGKNFAASGAVGPWMVSVDEFADLDSVAVESRVNGEVRQKDTSANMIFGFAYLLACLSQFMELKPGDLIATGTPTGAGIWFDPPRFLKAGDVVEIEVGGVGVLANPVADEVVD